MSEQHEILPPGWDGDPVSGNNRRALLWLIAVALAMSALMLWISYA